MREGDRVVLPDGKVGSVIEAFEDGFCLVEFPTPDGPHRYDDDVFGPDDMEPVEEK